MLLFSLSDNTRLGKESSLWIFLAKRTKKISEKDGFKKRQLECIIVTEGNIGK